MYYIAAYLLKDLPFFSNSVFVFSESGKELPICHQFTVKKPFFYNSEDDHALYPFKSEEKLNRRPYPWSFCHVLSERGPHSILS
jgi:hypothetical protein